MGYKVIRDRLGATKSVCLENAAEAAELARRFVAEGRREVRVVAPDGTSYFEPAFDGLLTKQGRGRNVRGEAVG